MDSQEELTDSITFSVSCMRGANRKPASSAGGSHRAQKIMETCSKCHSNDSLNAVPISSWKDHFSLFQGSSQFPNNESMSPVNLFVKTWSRTKQRASGRQYCFSKSFLQLSKKLGFIFFIHKSFHSSHFLKAQPKKNMAISHLVFVEETAWF